MSHKKDGQGAQREHRDTPQAYDHTCHCLKAARGTFAREWREGLDLDPRRKLAEPPKEAGPWDPRDSRPSKDTCRADRFTSRAQARP
jgi:hypothetical protein